MLARAALIAGGGGASGMLESLPPSKKVQKLQERLTALSLDADAAAPSSAAPSAPESQAAIRARALAHAQAKGPYKGRPVKRLFKGKTDERKRPMRARETQRKLEGMDKEISEWRKVSALCCAVARRRGKREAGDRAMAGVCRAGYAGEARDAAPPAPQPACRQGEAAESGERKAGARAVSSRSSSLLLHLLLPLLPTSTST
jgi:hypothetical protein